MPPVTAAVAIATYRNNHNVSPMAIADTAADLLANMSGINTLETASKIVSVTLTGTSNKVSVSQAQWLASLTDFSIGGGATLVVQDSVANLLDASSSLGTSFQMYGDSTVTAAQMVTLAALPGFGVASGSYLLVADTAANLLADAVAVADATATHITGTSNVVTAAQMTTLAGLPRLALATGATVEVSDTAANVLANTSAVTSYATSTQLSGANTVSAAQATTLVKLKGFSLAGGATFVVQDSAANLLAGSAWYSAATGVTVTGTSNTVNTSQANKLASLTGISLAGGATLVVEDSAVNLLASSAAAGEALATSTVLSGTANTEGAAKATTLADMTNFSLAGGATLTVKDTALNLANGAYTAGIDAATSIVITGDCFVDAAQLNAVALLPNLTEQPSAEVHVEDTAANLLTLTAGAQALATWVLLSTNTTMAVSELVSLAALGKFGAPTGVLITVSDSAANMLADIATVARYSADTILTGDNTVTAAQATSLGTTYHLTIGDGATLLIDDTYANIQSMLTTNAAAPTGYGLPDNYTAIETAAPVSAAASLQGDSHVISFTISDTASNLNGNTAGAGLIPLEFDTKLTGITATTAGAIELTYAQYTGLSHVISLISGPFSLDVIDVPVADAAAMQSYSLVSSFSVADTFSNVESAYSTLQTYTKLAEIDPVYQAAFDPSAMSFYGMFSANSLWLNAVPATDASSVSALSSVTQYSITDTAEDVTSAASSIAQDPKLNSIDVTSGNTLNLSGVVTPATIQMSDDSSHITSGAGNPALTFSSTPDQVTLGSGPSTIDYTLTSASGMEIINNFVYGLDQLVVDLNSAASDTLKAFNVTVDSVSGIYVTSSNDKAHGVVLLGSDPGGTAANLINNHTTFSGGNAVIT